MKKTPSALQRKPRRLSLKRETIQVLNDPALELARGGLTDTLTQPTQQQESTSHQVGC
ncbi:MAG: hypothetical protein ACJ75H_17730 [Thermoanaerobaculia bacterium]